MNLKHRKTNQAHKADISLFKKEDYDWIEKNNQYKFDWKIERKNKMLIKAKPFRASII